MKLRPNRLSIHKMWKLYRLLKKDTTQEYLLDEVIEMMQSIDSKNIKDAIGMMYVDMSLNPLEVALMFTEGLKYNHFFDFQSFVRTLNGNPQ